MDQNNNNNNFPENTNSRIKEKEKCVRKNALVIQESEHLRISLKFMEKGIRWPFDPKSIIFIIDEYTF